MKKSKALFQEWQGKPLEEILYHCRELLDDVEFPTVRSWRERGGKVLGHFQVYFPEEIAHAGGVLPFKIRGAPVETRKAGSHFGSYLCSIVKTSIELGLSGDVELDMFVTHPICDAARNLAGIWGRNFPYTCRILYLPQNPNSSHSTSYLAHEYGRLQEEIEEVAGRKITDRALRNSISVFNQNRLLLRKLYHLKRDKPWLVSGDEAYTLTALAGLLAREEHNELLESVLPLFEDRETRVKDRIRVVFEGGFCEQPPLDLIRAICRSCYLVDDDLLIGLRWILEDVPAKGDPLVNLAEAYIEKSSYSPVQHDLRKPKEKMLLDRIRQSKAEAAIITAAKMCEPGLEEQVCYTHALEEAGIPYFVGEFEENMTGFDHFELQLETFVENLLLFD